jgi:hypothetical protein
MPLMLERAMSDLRLDDVEPVLSMERLKYWTRVAAGDPQLGLVLHHRNSLIAGFLYLTLHRG